MTSNEVAVGTILGVNRRTYPKEGFGGSWVDFGTTITVVRVAGAIGDYAAYVGDGTNEWVARNGHKVSTQSSFEKSRTSCITRSKSCGRTSRRSWKCAP